MGFTLPVPRLGGYVNLEFELENIVATQPSATRTGDAVVVGLGFGTPTAPTITAPDGAVQLGDSVSAGESTWAFFAVTATEEGEKGVGTFSWGESIGAVIVASWAIGGAASFVGAVTGAAGSDDTVAWPAVSPESGKQPYIDLIATMSEGYAEFPTEPDGYVPFVSGSPSVLGQAFYREYDSDVEAAGVSGTQTPELVHAVLRVLVLGEGEAPPKDESLMTYLMVDGEWVESESKLLVADEWVTT